VSKIFTTRRRIAIVGVTGAALVLAGGGAAYAYFSATGSGTGSATVGTTGTWAVTQASSTGTISAGAGSSVITFNVENTGKGDQQYATATATVNSDSSGDITSGGASVSGCLATWFSTKVTSDPGAGTNVGGSSTVQVTVKVTMPSDATDNQDACENATPDVTLSIS
jgi:hypothetical protein